MSIKFALYDKGINMKELNFIVRCLTITCGCCLFLGVIGNVNLYFELSQKSTENLLWQILPESITLLIMAFCSIFMTLILRNVNQDKIFTHKNAAYIIVIGGLIELNGFIQGALSPLSTIGIKGQGYVIYLLIGLFFLFIGCVFKLGVKMKEEQDLTI